MLDSAASWVSVAAVEFGLKQDSAIARSTMSIKQRISSLRPSKLRKRLAKRKVEREICRIDQLPRRTPGVTDGITVAGRQISFVDGQSFEQQYRHIIEQGIYDFDSENEFPTMIDAGANIGLGALRFFERFAQGNLVAFEPDPQIFSVLKKNLEGFDPDRVMLRNSALWDEDGEIDFHEEHADAGSVVRADQRDAVKVATERLSTYLTKPIDFLKIDIEGAELEVLKEAQSKLAFVRNLFVEHHSFVGKEQNLDDLLSLLSDSGFRYNIETSARRKPYFYQPKVYCGMDGFVHIYAYRQ